MTAQECVCELNSGNWTQHFGGPKLTPYAEALINSFDTVTPFFITVPTGLTGSSTERRIVSVPAYQYDILIIGGHINGFTEANGDFGQTVFMNVSDDRSKLSWVTPSPIGWSPLNGFAGVDLNAMPILNLPEAYLLPRHVRLRHEFNNITNSQASSGSITWVGLQLINKDRRPAPKMLKFPNGNDVQVGSRMPLLFSIGLGRETYLNGVFTFNIGSGNNYVHYTPPVDCDVEIHDIIVSDSVINDLSPELTIKILDVGDRGMWRPNRAPANQAAGMYTQVYPALPFTKPYILKKGHRLQISIQNGDTDTAVNNAFMVIRGVRLCEY